MRSIIITKSEVQIGFSLQELSFISNAINEALETIESWEFHSRTGETKEGAMKIHQEIQQIIAKANN